MQSSDAVVLFLYFCSDCFSYEQYVEDAYVAFLKQKGQAEQVSGITSELIIEERRVNS